jgi:hypothetical protein
MSRTVTRSMPSRPVWNTSRFSERCWGALAEREGNLGISASAQRWNAKRSEHRSGGRDILLHEPFERLGNPMDRLGRHKLQALCVAVLPV